MTASLPAKARLALLLVGLYVRLMPWPRGKGLLIRQLLRPTLPPRPAAFGVVRPGGTVVQVFYREVIGISALIHGGFEDAECRTLRDLAAPGSTVIDVGANCGLHAIPLAQAVGPTGEVIAVEALSENAVRLNDNVQHNDLGNVRIVVAAAGITDGALRVQLAEDPAYASTRDAIGYAAVSVRDVPAVRLDQVAGDNRRGDVSVLKIDVEGSELEVLRGATEILSSCRPAVMVEAKDEASLAALEAELALFGYQRKPVDGFMPWNHLFVHRSPQSKDSTAS